LAFKAAPPYFREELCRLKYAFVDSSGAFDWGFWEAPDQRDPGNEKKHRRSLSYITLYKNTISEALQSPTGKPLADHENAILTLLLGMNAQQVVNYKSATPDTTGLAILAALAHEMGHVLWFRERAEQWDDCTTDNDDFFFGSWSTVAPLPHRTHLAKEYPTGSQHANGETAVTAIAQHQPSVASPEVQVIYTNGVWASLFAAVDPDEDFAETYKLQVLKDAAELGGHVPGPHKLIRSRRDQVVGGRLFLNFSRKNCLPSEAPEDEIARRPTLVQPAYFLTAGGLDSSRQRLELSEGPESLAARQAKLHVNPLYHHARVQPLAIDATMSEPCVQPRQCSNRNASFPRS
jgi:hypothetical protein